MQRYKLGPTRRISLGSGSPHRDGRYSDAHAMAHAHQLSAECYSIEVWCGVRLVARVPDPADGTLARELVPTHVRCLQQHQQGGPSQSRPGPHVGAAMA